MTKCPSCESDNPKDNKFCRNCGKPMVDKGLEYTCGKCGATVKLGDEYCGKCGDVLEWDNIDMPDLKQSKEPIKISTSKKETKTVGSENTQKKSSIAGSIMGFIIFLVIVYFAYNWLSGGNPIESISDTISGIKECGWTDKGCIGQSLQDCQRMKTRVDTMYGFREWRIEGREGGKCRLVNVMEESIYRVTKNCLYDEEYLSNKSSFSDLSTGDYCEIKKENLL